MPHEVLHLVQGHLVGRHGEQPAVGIQARADAHRGKVSRRGAGGHGHVDRPQFAVAFGRGGVGRLEHLGLALADVHGRHHDGVQGLAQAPGAEVGLQRRTQAFAAVLGPEHRARQAPQLAQAASGQGAVRKHGGALLGEDLHQPRHGDLEGQRQREHAADGRAGDELEAPPQRLAHLLLQGIEHAGGVQAEKPASR
jgi:hypothetical protein